MEMVKQAHLISLMMVTMILGTTRVKVILPGVLMMVEIQE